MNAEILKEVQYTHTEKFHLGEYIYMGMGLVNQQRVCISVAYKIEYCIKKARQFEIANENVIFTHINKVKIGELERCKKFELFETASAN
jgi:hypothetical protein